MISAWPFVVVILIQMAVGGFSVYVLSATRGFVTGESLWSKGQHEAIYFLNLYLETDEQKHLDAFRRAIAVPLEYRKGRQLLEARPPDKDAARRAFEKAGNPPEDLPSLIWMFSNFRGFSYLEDAITNWKETDLPILEIDRMGEAASMVHAPAEAEALRERLVEIDNEITPKTVAFSNALNAGARLVEWLLMLSNFALAGVLACLTVWRVGRVLAQRREVESKLAWQASHDELTGLLNRRAFEEHLGRSMQLRTGAPLSRTVMFVDLDQFKIVNDTSGHEAGDALLCRICPGLQAVLGEDAVLARLGGDEFGIFLCNKDIGEALFVAERVRAAVERVSFVWNGRRSGTTASVGLMHDATGNVSRDDIMRAADVACFMAKEKGRNRVHIHRDQDLDLSNRVREMNWVQRIQYALDQDRFSLYAQEIVGLKENGASGLHIEILLRLRDESDLIVPPTTFLSAAERFGLIKQIDRWVVRNTFRCLQERAAMPRAEPIACCAINLSGATIGDEAFLSFLEAAFAEFRIPPERICFEVTETSAILDLNAARRFVHALQAFGSTFALDDFGSGMSSFNYLKELPIDFVKIDGSFVKGMLHDSADRAIVEMICHVGHVMGKQIIAEFVETKAIAEALRDIGVDYGQGYGIAKPKPFDASFKRAAKWQPALPPRNRKLTA
jgi:diguanylate cyclase (GGDEF)-like protein